jgi:hypothetical protein
VFRRHRREDADRSGRDSDDELDELDLDDDELAEPDEEPGPGAAGPGRGGLSAGPWDAAGGYPEAERMDFGSLLVPMREGFDIQVNLDEQSGMWIAVVHSDSALQLQAFAAPKTSGLWDEVREEIAAEVARSGGRSEEAAGPFGAELLARLTETGPGRQPEHALRFMGADGPRWFLRGLLTGPAVLHPDQARAFEEVFADVVVVRGDHAEPPRKALDIQLPEEARQALEEQMGIEQGEGEEAGPQGMPSPFERGPEITETR